jgi:hypothetical protein
VLTIVDIFSRFSPPESDVQVSLGRSRSPSAGLICGASFTTSPKTIASEPLARIAKLYLIEKTIQGQSPDGRRAVRQQRSKPPQSQERALRWPRSGAQRTGPALHRSSKPANSTASTDVLTKLVTA